jgi:hypothetical protein
MSPAHSASTTPVNLSPTSPRNPNMLPQVSLAGPRQLRPPKVPMYVPAVLRPTERPHRPSPLTPPRSVHGSTDSLDGSGNKHLPASRTSTSDGKNKELSEQALQEQLSDLAVEEETEVTGPPTREHWKPDANAIICDAPVCQRTFNLFERRHHCRHCGHVFCSTHSPYAIPLDQDANFHMKGAPSRACKHCYEQYRQWSKTRGSRKNSISSGNSTIAGTPAIGTGKNSEAGTKDSVATSVPKDFYWSTF